MALTTAESSYEPRVRGTELLYCVIEQHLETFLADAAAADRTVPAFVRRAFWEYLDCGIVERGFALLRCPDCHLVRTVPFSCKNRGFCPSCLGRRMCQSAAHLVDDVLPHVPVRQWVLSLPIPLRFTLARQPELRRAVLRTFLRVVFRWYQRRAESEGVSGGRTGGVVFSQGFGSSLNCNLHFHAIILDGCFAPDDAQGPLVFHGTKPPTTEEAAQIVATVHRRIDRLLLRRGLLDDDPDSEQTDDAQTLMQLASVSGRVALGTRAGRRPRALIGAPGSQWCPPKRCAQSGYYSLHAGVRIAARDRSALERLCRYILRPPLSHSRLSERDDGNLVLRLKTPWRNGTTAIVLSPSELLQRLAAIIPRPRVHQLTYHGVLAGNAAWRSLIVPTPPEAPERGCLHTARTRPERDRSKWRGRWIAWAQLLFRVFRVESLRCDCGGWMAVHAIVIGPPATQRAIQTLQPKLLVRSRAPPANAAAA